MFKLINGLMFLFEGEDTGSGGGSGELSVQELMDALKDDEPDKEDDVEVIDLKEPKKEDKKEEAEEDKEEKDPEEDDEEKDEKTLEDEIEEELKEPTEEELDTEEAIHMPSRREMLTKYPNLFKDFPHLERAFYREQKYTEHFPTIKDAQEASIKARTWDNFERSIGEEGDVKTLFSALIQGNDKSALHRVVDNIIPALREVDEPAVQHIYSGIVKEVIEAMVAAGSKSDKEHLKVAAQLVHQFVFGEREYQPHQPLAKEVKKDERAEELAKKERQIFVTQFKAAREDVSKRVDNTIRATIERAIDPRNSMSAYVKAKAIQDVFEDTQEMIKGDKRFQGVMTRLWERAAKEDFSENSRNAIRSALMSKAKQLLPTTIQKGRKIALGGKAVSKGKEKESTESGTPKEKDSKPGKTASLPSGKTDRERARAIPKDVSTKDFLLSD